MTGRVLTGLMIFVLGIVVMFVGAMQPEGWYGYSLVGGGFVLSLLSAGNAGMQWGK
jgi:hypothetical protein